MKCYEERRIVLCWLWSSYRLLHSTIRFRRRETYYDVLGVTPSSSKQEIKSAFFKLSKQLHPDVIQAAAKDKKPTLKKRSFIDISEAYDTLSDPVKRAQYDHELRTINVYAAEYHARQSSGSHSVFHNSRYGHYSNNQRDYGFNERYTRSSTPNHARVVLSLIAFMFIGTGVHSYRINSAHKKYLQESQQETKRNNELYARVRERAKNSSVQDQLLALSHRYAETIEQHSRNK